MSASEDLVIVESSDYAQVVFEDVKEVYTNTEDLECVFTLNELLKGDESIEWVGIYKVGFSSCSEFTAKSSIDIINDNKGKAIFPVEVLPKEDGEFYQFVYVTNSKQIRGASVPFQFKTEECEFTEDEEQDAVVVKFDNNETINEIKNRCAMLTTANETYQKLIKENETVIKSLKDDVAAIKLRCFRLTMDNEKLNFTLRNKADSLKNLAETITSLTSDNDSLQMRFNDLSNDNKNLLVSLQERIDQVASLKKELESIKICKSEFNEVLSLKENEIVQLEKDKDELNRIAEELTTINDQIDSLESQVVERTEELDEIKNTLKKNNVIVSEQAEQIEAILKEKTNLVNLVETLKEEKAVLENDKKEMVQELTMSKDKLEAVEKSKELLKSQFECISAELEETKKQMSVNSNIANDLNDRLAEIEIEKSNNDNKLRQFKEEYEEKLNQINGSYYVLRVAHNSLETRLKTSEQKREKVEAECENYRRTTDELQKENEELKERIRYGAIEYQKIFEKYRLIKNQRFNNEINYQDGCDNHLTRRRIGSTHTKESDSAIHDKTGTQSARASTDDSENTLLDALLGSSFYNGSWNNQKTRVQEIDQSCLSKMNSTTNTQTTARTTQPKSSDFTDLAQAKISKNEKLNLSQQLNKCQIEDPSKIEDCDVCDFVFPTGVNMEEREQHIASHHGKQCPVCFLNFHSGIDQQEFEAHVNTHFIN